MSDGDAVRKLLMDQASGHSVVVPVSLAAGIYVLLGVGVYAFIAITWDTPPGPFFFLVMFDILFVLLALGGLTFRSDEEPGAGTLSGLRIVFIASGGAWQVMKSFVKGLLFVVPYGAFEAVRSVLPPVGAADDPEALKVLRRLSVMKGSVPLPLFRYLCGDPAKASFHLALEAAAYLDAGHVRGRGDETKVVPGLHIARLAAAVGAGQKKPATATRPGTLRTPTA